MKRRRFLSHAPASAGLLAAVPIVSAQESRPVKATPFKLKYAPHPRMFQHSRRIIPAMLAPSPHGFAVDLHFVNGPVEAWGGAGLGDF